MLWLCCSSRLRGCFQCFPAASPLLHTSCHRRRYTSITHLISEIYLQQSTHTHYTSLQRSTTQTSEFTVAVVSFPRSEWRGAGVGHPSDRVLTLPLPRYEVLRPRPASQPLSLHRITPPPWLYVE